MINEKRNCEYTDCGVIMDEFPRMGTCCCKSDNPVASYEKICIWCSIWTSLPDGASLKTATIFECDQLGYGKRVTEQHERRRISRFENRKDRHKTEILQIKKERNKKWKR